MVPVLVSAPELSGFIRNPFELVTFYKFCARSCPNSVRRPLKRGTSF